MISSKSKSNWQALSPALFWDALIIRKMELEHVLKQLDKEIAISPKGSVIVSKSNNVDQFYIKPADSSNKNGKYVSRSELSLIRCLIQNDYNRRVSKSISKELKVLQKILAIKGEVESTYQKMGKNKRQFVKPVYLDNQAYAQQWLSVEYEHKPFVSGCNEYYTPDGLRVRSKSEIIIATILDKYKIPYRYEFPVALSALTVHPDFYCLNIRTRNEFAWEHFGMMDNPEYSVKATEKIHRYEQCGYFVGKNMIATFETSSLPVNSKLIEQIVKQYLL